MSNGSSFASSTKPIFGCDVLYIGSSLPLETVSGLDAFRIPLQQRYTVVNCRPVGIESVLAIHDTGIGLQLGLLLPCGSGSSPSSWFPIQSLHSCAGLRACKRISSTGGLDFDWVGSETEDATHPPVFAFISRHTRGLKILECHLFVCRSEAAALCLADSCGFAFSNWRRWSNDRVVSLEGDLMLSNSMATLSTDTQPRLNKYNDGHLNVGVPLSGFVYGDSMELIPKHNIHWNDGLAWDSKSRSHPPGSSLVFQRDNCGEGVRPITDGSNQRSSVPVQSFRAAEKSNDKKASKWSKVKKKFESSGGKKTEEEEGEDVIEHYYYIRPCNCSAGYYEDGSHNGDLLLSPAYPRTGVPSYYSEDCAQYAPRNNRELHHYRQCALEDYYTRPHDCLGRTFTRPSGCAGVPCIVVPEHDQFRLVAAETVHPMFVPHGLTLEAGVAKNTEDIEGYRAKEIHAEIDFVGATGQRQVVHKTSLMGSGGGWAARSKAKILTDAAVSNHRNNPSNTAPGMIDPDRRSTAIEAHGTRAPSPIPDYPMDENADHHSSSNSSSVPQHRDIESIYAVPLKRLQAARTRDSGFSVEEAGPNIRMKLFNSRSKNEIGLRAEEEDSENELPTSQHQQQRNRKYIQLIQELGYMP